MILRQYALERTTGSDWHPGFFYCSWYAFAQPLWTCCSSPWPSITVVDSCSSKTGSPQT